MSLLFKATQSGWYPQFLNPVIESLPHKSGNLRILDIGTGTGKLPQLLIQHNENLIITGSDIDNRSIEKARKLLIHKNANFVHQKANQPLQLDSEEFDVAIFCSVLFLVNDSVKNQLVGEALRLLKPGGKIIVLTPSGKKAILSAFVEVWEYPFNLNNWTFIVWKAFTTFSARKWNKNLWLKKYSKLHGLQYFNKTVFNNNAIIETLIKP